MINQATRDLAFAVVPVLPPPASLDTDEKLRAFLERLFLASKESMQELQRATRRSQARGQNRVLP